MKHKTLKYTKRLAKAEMTSKSKLKGLLDSESQKMHKGYFELSGAYPYVFDIITYICNYYQHNVINTEKKIDAKIISDTITQSDSVTHHSINIPWDSCLDIALGDYCHGKNRHRFKSELYTLARNPLPKVLPWEGTQNILTLPVRCNIITEEGNAITGNITNYHIEKVIIDFFRPLWEGLFSGKHGVCWFRMPSAFYSKIYGYMDTKNTKVTPLQVRKLYMFVKMHDNKKGSFVNHDIEDIVINCFPGLIQIKKGKPYQKDKKKSKQFIEQCVDVLVGMQREKIIDNYLKGVDFVRNIAVFSMARKKRKKKKKTANK